MAILDRLGSYRGLFSSAGTYAVVNALNAGIPYLLLPVIIRYMSTAEFGYYSIFLVVFQLLISVIGLTTHSAIARVYFDPKEHHLGTYIYNCLLIMAGSVIAVLLLLWASARWLGPGVLPLEPRWIVVGTASGLGQYFILVQLSLWQMEAKPLKYAALQMSLVLFLTVLTLYRVIHLRLGWVGCLQAHVAAYLLFGGVALVALARAGRVRARFHPPSMLHALKYGIPLVPHNIGSWIIGMMDRIILLKMVGASETGIYSFAYTIGMAIAMLQNSFNQAYVPWLFRKLKSATDETRKEVVRLTYGYSLVIIVVAVGLGLMGPIIVKVVGTKAYASAQGIILWVALAYAVNGMYKMMANYIFFAQKTYVLAITTSVAAALNVLLTILWVKRFGSIGAAYATLAAFAVSFALTWWMAQRAYPMPWFRGWAGGKAETL